LKTPKGGCANKKYIMPVLHPWHEIHYGDQSPQQVTGVIEIPKGSKAKYEIDKASGLLKLDRVIYSSFHYPINYGFIPRTLGDDGDPLDILVLCSIDIAPLCLVQSKVIGNMQMMDCGQMDDKIIAVAANDPSVNHYNTISELPQHLLSEIKHFFEEYKTLENKVVEIDNFQTANDAYNVINAAIALYQEKH
jgi:inorganic pyrophosphatase